LSFPIEAFFEQDPAVVYTLSHRRLQHCWWLMQIDR